MKKLVVILDPAHGNDVAGKRSPDNTHFEYIWSRCISTLISQKLKAKGFRVEYTSTEIKEIGLSKRKQNANNIRIDAGEVKFLLSIHNNASTIEGWGKAKGFEIYTHIGKSNSDIFADIIMEKLMKAFPKEDGYLHRLDLSDGDYDKENNFTVLMGSYSAVLLEWLFMDNRSDLKKIKDASINYKLANTLVDAIVEIQNYLNKTS